jgi:asparagine N-glycosylation enzyme membrane subunit Stt3
VTFWLIRIPYWLGSAADALWAVALLFPPVFGTLTGADL